MGGYVFATFLDCSTPIAPWGWPSGSSFTGPTTSPWPDSWPKELGFLMGGFAGGSPQDCDGYTVDDTWSAKANTPEYLWGAGISNVDNKIYVAYGFDGGSRKTRTDEYVVDIWTSKTAAISPARSHLASSHIGNSKMYLMGGFTGAHVADNDSYDPDTWTSKTNLVSPARQTFDAATLDDKIYCVGGHDGTNLLEDCDQYVDDTWTVKNGFGTVTFSISIFAIGSCLYKAYGSGMSGRVNTCLEYTLDFWTSKTDGVSPVRLKAATIELKHSGLVLGGRDSATIADNDEYDPDTWTSRAAVPSPSRESSSGSYIT